MKGEGFIGKRVIHYEEQFYLIFRIIVGWLFFMHGTAKVFGWFWSLPPMTGFMMYVGIFETLLGILILLGIWTRLGAIIGIVIKGWNPFANGGEIVIVFFVAFLIILIYGSGKYGLEHWMKKKECI
jgi:putative oxidoreductase